MPIEDVDKYGMVKGRQLDDSHIRVKCMAEKPAPQDAPSNLAVIGRYILTSDIFEILRNTPPGKNGEVQLTDALQTQAVNGKVIAYRFQGRRFDCGSIEGFVTAANFYFNRRKTVATHNGDTTKK